MDDQRVKFRRSSQLGFFTGVLLLGLGIFLLISRPEGGKFLPFFMIVYGLVRFGTSAWQLYGKKQDAEQPEA